MKQHELGAPAAYIARKPGIAEQTSFRSKKQGDALEASEHHELKQLRQKKARLNKRMADLGLGRTGRQERV